MKFEEEDLQKINFGSIDLRKGMTKALPENKRNNRSIVDLYENKRVWLQDVLGTLNSETSGSNKQHSIKRITDKWTRTFGNYIGCKFWTEDALDLYKKLGKPGKEFKFSKHFVHEHAMPQNAFIQIFTKPQTEYAVMALLYNGLNGVVVTHEEDKKLRESGLKSTMPSSFYIKDEDWELMWLNPWARYIEADLKRVFLCKWEEEQLIKEEYFEIRRDFRISIDTNF
ncbi:hypothetical protein P8831_25840 [Priestia megaterium]|uniref:hypothetical protein n=1 Tax=Priestia megaterium TaxID=1404 RepID=UPI002D7E1675|nr:hypothetical protein [Priestia megaterium]MEB4872106.1 hypothetical protein [Priestia megaterium]